MSLPTGARLGRYEIISLVVFDVDSGDARFHSRQVFESL